jgi:hypothetical protein
MPLLRKSSQAGRSEVDFIGSGVIARVPNELIAGAFLLMPIRCSAPRFSRVWGALTREIQLYCEQ